MGLFILRRLVSSIPVLIGILIVTFALGRLIPGDPCKAMLGEKANPAVCADFIERFGFNKPLPQQFAIYAGNFLHGDLGDSIRFGRPVRTMLVERCQLPMELPSYARCFGLLLGIRLAMI